MSVRAECAMRAQAGKLLSACALMLDLSHAPTMTAAMFLHRFYAHRSFIEYPESEVRNLLRALDSVLLLGI